MARPAAGRYKHSVVECAALWLLCMLTVCEMMQCHNPGTAVHAIPQSRVCFCQCCQVADAGSLNGTLLNGTRISAAGRRRGAAYRLNSDDLLQLGTSTAIKVLAPRLATTLQHCGEHRYRQLTKFDLPSQNLCQTMACPSKSGQLSRLQATQCVCTTKPLKSSKP